MDYSLLIARFEIPSRTEIQAAEEESLILR